MNEALKLLILLLLSVKCSHGKRYPCWPSEFKWSYNGTIEDDGYQCLHVIELAEPWYHFWYDNYLCAKSGPEFYDIGWKWSQIGPIDGMNCVNTYEHSSPHYWYDNYLCVPSDKPYNFKWTSGGCLGDNYCIHFNEPASPWDHTWFDNYLCHTEMDNCNYTNVKKIIYGGKCSSATTHQNVGSLIALLLILSVVFL